jgi:hypothetical protein
MTVEEQIEEILIEASTYGLRSEVVEWAKKFMNNGYERIEAYELAYSELIK